MSASESLIPEAESDADSAGEGALSQALPNRLDVIRDWSALRYSSSLVDYGNYQIQLFEDTQEQINHVFKALDKIKWEIRYESVLRAVGMGIGEGTTLILFNG